MNDATSSLLLQRMGCLVRDLLRRTLRSPAAFSTCSRTDDPQVIDHRPFARGLREIGKAHGHSFDHLRQEPFLHEPWAQAVQKVLWQASRFDEMGLSHALLLLRHEGEWLVVLFDMDPSDGRAEVQMKLFSFGTHDQVLAGTRHRSRVRAAALDNLLRDYRSLAELIHVCGRRCTNHAPDEHWTSCRLPPHHGRLELRPLSTVEGPVRFEDLGYESAAFSGHSAATPLHTSAALLVFCALVNTVHLSNEQIGGLVGRLAAGRLSLRRLYHVISECVQRPPVNLGELQQKGREAREAFVEDIRP